MSPRMTYQERLEKCNKPILKKLFKIIIEKQTNLCVAANFDTIEELFHFIELCGKHICILKLQHEILGGYTEQDLKMLYQKKREHNFLLFEDRKFGDDKNTVYLMYKKSYVKYFDLVTVYPRPSNIEGIEKAVAETILPEDEPRAYLAVSELSFDKVLLDPLKSIEVVDESSPICAGIIAQTLNVKDTCNMIKACPGVHLSLSTDGGTQNWNHPSKLVDDGADVLIVGRGIITSPKEKLEETTRTYKEVCYSSYLKATNK